ncbi:extracellular solute-binding protein [Paenibacillus alkalitolerans]|uniref:extracellular solute-binding protein n=1 Tax=Paenibacillus alkalitolerans TaxID=2799335 RepID=UPI001F16D314|nr:extracellular solute-binding protein [Paenibacillus alkalitolerans]
MKALLRISRTWTGIMLALTLALSPALPAFSSEHAASEDSSGTGGEQLRTQTNVPGGLEPSYQEVLEKWKKEGAAENHTGIITIAGPAFTGKSDNAHVSVGSYGGKNNVLVWNSASDEWVEFEVEVEQGGLYAVDISYHPFVDGTNRLPVTLNVTLDGANHYVESRSVQLYRRWKDQMPALKDDYGDEMRPKSIDSSEWVTAPLRDSGGAYTDPLLWHLTPGKHTLRFASSNPMAIESITLKPPSTVADYNTVRNAVKAEKPSAAVEPIVIEAEQAQWKSDSSIALGYDNDIYATPYKRGNITYNVIGGTQWAAGNQEVAWSFDVPESGFYKIAMRALQFYSSNRSSFRTITVNGQVPFSEMEAYRFQYSTGWQGVSLEDGEGKPFEFYLEKGTNTLSMRVTQAPLKPLTLEMENLVAQLKEMVLEIEALTGGTVDPNRTWNTKRDLPGFVDKLSGVYGNLQDIRRRLESVNGRSDAVTQGIVTVEKDIETHLRNVNDIPFEGSKFVSIQGKLAEFVQQLNSQPLQLDRIYIVPAGQDIPKMTPGFLENIKGAIINFFYSFQTKKRLTDVDDEEVLNVWVQRGRDYVNLLQQLSDEMFTPETGIKVKVNLLPGSDLLVLMNAADISPDVALGLSQDLPFEYAVRNALYDLSSFPDFKEMYDRFPPGIWTPLYYDGGYYGVPETQTFEMLYYRKDIMDRLGLEVPDTWEDVYKMLPTLHQNNMNMPPITYTPIFYQNGAEFFTNDGMKTGFNNPTGFEAFKTWTDLYNLHAVERQAASFYQSFRSGIYPIGISEINTYIQLMVAAPELNGLWGVAPIPGVRQPDGTVARWMSGGMQTGVIFKKTKKAEEAWKFLKWWTSAEVQERYGTDLETVNGITFRWNTSNIDAFVKLPWKSDDLQSILEQWRWFKQVPNVPGSYYLDREIQNAWNRTVVDGINYRSSLETAIKDIEREMYRKLQEFNFIDTNGSVVRSMNMPQVTEPWKGVDKYVKDGSR